MKRQGERKRKIEEDRRQKEEGRRWRKNTEWNVGRLSKRLLLRANEIR